MKIIRWAMLLSMFLGAFNLVLAEDVTEAPTAEMAAPSEPAPAAEAESTPPAAAPTLDAGNTAWMITATALVLLMTIPGVALFYGGMVRKKNVLSMMMMSFVTVALVTILWTAISYSLAFAEGNAFVGGLGKAMLAGVGVGTLSGTIPESVFFMFQLTFAIITAALITGAVADRMKFSALLWFISIWSVVVYAPITHWVWAAGGWLFDKGILDYAGGTVVHINAGVAGLVAAIVLGKRLGYGKEAMAPHNLTLTLVGAALLWVGWFGFNAGSALAADGRAGMAMAVTQIATAAAALAWIVTEWLVRGKPSALGLASGAVAGLVAITPASGFVGPAGALVIGLVAGVLCYWGATWLKHKLGVDDSLDAFGVHGIGGIVGAILTGVFAMKEIGGVSGLLEGNGGQVVTQIIGVGATVLYTAVMTFIILKVIDVIIGLRVTEEQEREGLDINMHGERVE